MPAKMITRGDCTPTPAQADTIRRAWLDDGASCVVSAALGGWVYAETYNPLSRIPFRIRHLAVRTLGRVVGERAEVDLYNRFCLDGSGHYLNPDGLYMFPSLFGDMPVACALEDL